MAIKLVWCQDQKFGIGYQNKLPWNDPEEMAHFVDTTKNKNVVMGRKTFESIGKPLKDRNNIVLTRNVNFKHEDVDVYHDVKNLLRDYSNQDLYVIGGKEIYDLFFDLADELIVSEMKATYKCDTFLKFDVSKFKLDVEINNKTFKVKYYIARRNQVFSFKISNFNGSLDLLWALIRERRYDLNDLDVEDLTDQYLDFVYANLHEIDLDEAAEYLVTAAQLINLKAKMIFALDENATEEAVSDFIQERDLLIKRLIEYKKIRKGISWLRKKQNERIQKFAKKNETFEEFLDPNAINKYLPKNINIDRLREAFENSLNKMRIRNFKKQQIQIQEVSVETVEEDLKKFLRLNNLTEFSFFNYLSNIHASLKYLQYFVIVFLTILTLVRIGQLTIEEKEQDLYFRKTEKWVEYNESKKETN